MSVITIESKAFKKIIEKLNFLEKTMKALSSNSRQTKWLTEEETMVLTGLGKRSLYNKRKRGDLSFTTATGRKIKYLRKDVEGYLNDNSTLIV